VPYRTFVPALWPTIFKVKIWKYHRPKNIINYIKNKLVWPFTSNTRKKNGNKSIQMETDVKKTTRKTKEQMGRHDIKKN
jgi:predicted GIY-YIG superfamily endonuclease